MGDIVAFPQVRAKDDGGRTRIQQRRKRLGLNEPFRGEDLTMDHADPEVCDDNFRFNPTPCDCA